MIKKLAFTHPKTFTSPTIIKLFLLILILPEIYSSNDTNSNETVLTVPDETEITEMPVKNATPAVPTVNETEVNSTSLTTTPSPSPTTSPPTQKPFVPSVLDNFYCSCDYHFNSCDLNCCCDPECSPEEKAVFSDCTDKPNASSQRERSCFKSDYFWRNNTPYVMEKSSSGMFCIAFDNYKGKNELSIPKFLPGRIPSLLSPKYKWEFSNTKSVNVTPGSYKFKDRLQAVRFTENAEFNSSFDMPSSFHGHECTAREPVLFMQNTREFCVHNINVQAECETLPNLNANEFLKGVSIVGNPTNSFAEDNLLNINSMICKSVANGKCEQTLMIDEPYYDGSSLCNNVLQLLDLTFVHNGAEGISEVLAKIVLASYSTDSNNVKQEFRVNFVWNHEFYEDENATTPDTEFYIKKRIEKSGNPGYTVGKPIVMGIKLFRDRNEENSNSSQIVESSNWKSHKHNEDKMEEKQESIWLNVDSTKWMTTLGPGDCARNNRRTVVFGKEVNTECNFNISEYKYCQKLDTAIGSVLLAVPPRNFTRRFVSSYGNHKYSQKQDWVQVISEYPFGPSSQNQHLVDNGCDRLTTSLRIQIVYAYVGLVKYPQAVILGVLYQYEDPTKLANKTERGEINHIVITTTVGFVDITGPTHTKLAEWPSLSVHLPAGFFYPFSSWSPNTGGRLFNDVGIISKLYFIPASLFAVFNIM